MKTYAGDQWILEEAKNMSMENFWAWDKVEGTNSYGDPVSVMEHCNDIKKEIWLEFG